jgi:DNA-binding NarL/FixJ family response regulator
VALSESASESDITAAVDAGACGYLLKESAIDDVAEAIRAAARGTAWLSPRVAQALLQRLRCDRVQVSQDVVAQEVLSPRETQVLKLLARGDDNNAIAAELSISRQTAKNHVSKILNKLGVSNRVQAATYAVRRGIT